VVGTSSVFSCLQGYHVDVSPPPNDREILALHISRRDLNELIDALQKAEDLCESMRSSAQDFRMHRVRLEVLKQSSVPPPPQPSPERRESTRYVELGDLSDLGLKKGPEGSPPK